MNHDTPPSPREELEARLTALLLGQLPDAEAAALREVMQHDAALAALHDRLSRTIALVRETAATAEQPSATPPAALKLSDQRRQKLLQHFKTVAPKEFQRPRRRAVPWLAVAAAAALMAILGAMLMPALSRGRAKVSGRVEGMLSGDETLKLAQDSAHWRFPSANANQSEQKALYLAHPKGAPQPTTLALNKAPAIRTASPAVEPPAAAKPVDHTIFLPSVQNSGEVAQTPLASPAEVPNGQNPTAGTINVGNPRWMAALDQPAVPHSSTNRFVSQYAYTVASSDGTLDVDSFSLRNYAGTNPSAPHNPAVADALAEAQSRQPNENLGRQKLAEAKAAQESGDNAAAKQLYAGINNKALGLQGGTAPSSNSEPLAGANPIVDPATGLVVPPGGRMTDVGGMIIDPATGHPVPIASLADNETIDPATGLPVPIASLGGAPAATASASIPLNYAKASDISQALESLKATPSSELAANGRSFQINAGNQPLALPPGGSPQPQTQFENGASGGGGGGGGIGGGAMFANSSIESETARRLRKQSQTTDASLLPGKRLPIFHGSPDDLSKNKAPLIVAAGRLSQNFVTVDNFSNENNRQDAQKNGTIVIGDSNSGLSDQTYAWGTTVSGVTNAVAFNFTTGDAKKNDEAGKAPLLGDVPFLGSLSRSRTFDDRSKDRVTNQGERQAGEAGTNEIYSLSIVGYANVPTSPGYTFKSNPFENDSSNSSPASAAAGTAGATAPGVAHSPIVLPPAPSDAGTEIAYYTAGPQPVAAPSAPPASSVPSQLREKEIQAGLDAEHLLAKSQKESRVEQSRVRLSKSATSTPADEPQPEVQSRDQAFSTFSLNVSDVSFKLAAASLEKGVLPEAASVRSEEFINAFDYRDPEPPPGVPVAFAWERARYPFAQNRDLLRFSIKTAAQGREPGRPLNLVLLLDTSGSMERADRVRIIHEALRVLAAQLQPQDKFSVVTFARTARLWVDGVAGNEAARIVEKVGSITPQGGTNLEEAMKLAYQTALRHYLATGINRVVLLTDGAANLGNVDPTALKQNVEAHRKQGIALDCFGIGWEGYNDDLLETLTRNGDGRYGFINTPEEAADGFAGQLAGALHVAASDVKVQVEFNPRRVTAYRQIGYAKHQLTKEQFRDNTVAAAQIGAAESGNALYVIVVNPLGEGPLGTVRVRYKVPGTGEVHEHEWTAPYNGNAVPLEEASPAMRLAATASAFSEWLASSPYAADVTPDRLLGYLRGVPEVCGADARPKKLKWMLRQAKSIAGK